MYSKNAHETCENGIYNYSLGFTHIYCNLPKVISFILKYLKRDLDVRLLNEGILPHCI